VAVGTAARFIAKFTHKGVPEEAYMAGLLHDFGFILCDQFLHKHFCTIIDQLQSTESTTNVENRVLSFDHAMLGGYVAQKWNFPESAVDAITFHHKPQEYRGLHEETLHIVVLANYLCSQAGYLSLGVNNALPPDSKILSSLELEASALTSLSEQLAEPLQAVQAAA
jgi:HD-like signal output (HDOD) protein